MSEHNKKSRGWTITLRLLGRPRLRSLLVGFLAVAMFSAGVFIAEASHNFADVPITAFYHDAVEWVFNRAITAGIGGGLYGPDQNVTRGQMAVFMRKLGIALTPITFATDANPGPVNPDLNPILCVTPSPASPGYTPSFPQAVGVFSWVSLDPDAALGFTLHNVFSTDNGATWSSLDALFSRGGGSDPHEWAHANQNSGLDLNPGTTYRFALRVQRDFGVAVAHDSRCEVAVIVFNRNPTVSPLGPVRRELPTVRDQRGH